MQGDTPGQRADLQIGHILNVIRMYLFLTLSTSDMNHYLFAGLIALGASHIAHAQAPAAPQTQVQLSVNQVVAHYSTLVSATYEDSIRSAQQMQKAIDAFLAKPSAATLATARKAWLHAREYYGQTEAFRFYGGPIDDENGPEGRINAWPMDESYVDYVQGQPKAGLINNRKEAITAERLAELNEHDGEENISTGWHAIEFMLWGQDLSATGPGDRPYTDFVDGKAPNADRRRAYLRTVTALLIKDLQSVAAQWKPGVAGNFRADFEKNSSDAVRRIFVGLGSLSRGELAGERMKVALEANSTERDWVAQHDRGVAEQTTRQIAQSVKAAESIPAPFDQAIQGARDSAARATIQATIDSLVAQSKSLVDAAHAVGIEQLNLVEPE